MALVTLDFRQVEKLEQTMKQVGDRSGKIINDYLVNQGGDQIKTEIKKILPQSGRTWNGKAPAAAGADSFRKTPMDLAVKVHTKNMYHYLYFPDDGSNTKHHQGGQEFMIRGAQSVAGEISENIINKLLEQLK